MSFTFARESHRRESQYKILLAGLVLSMAASCCLAISSVKNTQKKSVRENATAYAGIMDERISVDLQGFMELNLGLSEEPSAMADFFYNRFNDRSADFLSEVRADMSENVLLLQNLNGLILYRSYDNTLLSTLNDHYFLTKLNPAYPYLMDSVAQADGNTPSFIHSADGSLLYYYPISAGMTQEETELLDSFSRGQISDCIIAVLHQSEDFLNVQLPMASSLSTFVVLKGGHVLSTEGYGPLSSKLVAAISEIAGSEDAVYTYTDLNLPDYYFYTVASQVSELNYCYYEPALTGWPLLQKAFFSPWGLLLLLLLSGALLLCVLLYDAQTHAGSIHNHGGHSPSGSEKPEENRVVDITVPYENADTFGSRPYFGGIIIDYHNMNGGTISPEILELFDSIICENLSVNKILYQFSSQRNSDCLQYYMNFNNYNLRVLSDSLKMNLYNAAPDYAINIFYTRAVSSYQKMEKDLLYLHQHLRYSLIIGYGHRLSLEQIRAFEESTAKLDDNVAGTIQNHLRTKAYENLYGYLKHCRDSIMYSLRPSRSTLYSFSEIYRFAEEAFSAVKIFFQENAFSHPMVQSTCISILRSNPGFGRLCDYLISAIQDYQQENEHVLSSRNEQIMNSIYTYIEQDLSGANLNSIARKMQMTDSHLSRVFKKNTGTNFSEYLSDRKLEEAARLLLQDSKIKVADIADMLGYGNPTYFLSRFKAKYGISPSAYRKEHLLNQTRQDSASGAPAASQNTDKNNKDNG